VVLRTLTYRTALRAGHDGGSILLPILFFMFGLGVVGVGLYLGGHSGALQAQGQSGADAAALAAVRAVRDGLYDAYVARYEECRAIPEPSPSPDPIPDQPSDPREECLAALPPVTDLLDTVSEAGVQAAASDYAGRNETQLLWLDHRGMEAVAMVHTRHAVPVPYRPDERFQPRAIARAVVVLKDSDGRRWWPGPPPARTEFAIFRLVPTGPVETSRTPDGSGP
jgi:hypothetical protein